VAFDPATGATLVTGSKDKTVRVIDVVSGQVLNVFQTGHSEPIIAVTYNPTGSLIATGSDDKTGE